MTPKRSQVGRSAARSEWRTALEAATAAAMQAALAATRETCSAPKSRWVPKPNIVLAANKPARTSETLADGAFPKSAERSIIPTIENPRAEPPRDTYTNSVRRRFVVPSAYEIPLQPITA
jgi:hypothetical protein